MQAITDQLYAKFLADLQAAGLTILSQHTLVLELQAGQLKLLDVVGMPLKRAWHVVSLGAMSLSPAAEAFRSFVLERGEAMLVDLFGGG